MTGVHDQFPELVPEATKFSCTPFTTNKYSILAVTGPGNENVHVPSPLLVPTGPPFGSQFHHGPVNLTEVTPVVSHTVAVINNGSYAQLPSSVLAKAL